MSESVGSATGAAGSPGGSASEQPPELAALLDSEELRTWLTDQRWYASKTLPV